MYFKTDNGGVTNLRQRLATTDVEWTNKQMTHHAPAREAGSEPCRSKRRTHPALRIALREGVKHWTPPPPDLLRWLDKGTTEEFAVTGDFPVDIIKIDFLTKPR